jgi:hypothetical protein
MFRSLRLWSRRFRADANLVDRMGRASMGPSGGRFLVILAGVLGTAVIATQSLAQVSDPSSSTSSTVAGTTTSVVAASTTTLPASTSTTTSATTSTTTTSSTTTTVVPASANAPGSVPAVRGKLYGWGSSANLLLAAAAPSQSVATDTGIAQVLDVSESVSSNNVVALSSDGSIKAWGRSLGLFGGSDDFVTAIPQTVAIPQAPIPAPIRYAKKVLNRGSVGYFVSQSGELLRFNRTATALKSCVGDVSNSIDARHCAEGERRSLSVGRVSIERFRNPVFGALEVRDQGDRVVIYVRRCDWVRSLYVLCC